MRRLWRATGIVLWLVLTLNETMGSIHHRMCSFSLNRGIEVQLSRKGMLISLWLSMIRRRVLQVGRTCTGILKPADAFCELFNVAVTVISTETILMVQNASHPLLGPLF